MECKQSAKDHTGDKWTLSSLNGLSTEEFWTWSKSDGLSYDGDAYLVMNKFVGFKKDIWFKLVNHMWRKQLSVFKGHLKYIFNNIVKPFCVRIFSYTERAQEMHELANHLPPLLIKGEIFDADN